MRSSNQFEYQNTERYGLMALMWSAGARACACACTCAGVVGQEHSLSTLGKSDVAAVVAKVKMKDA